ncbi:hypothetical protein D915_001651 [Fasciola hepatica]|uniref:Uncharacterized protein n=1 Tax=Fasciola hepatica TaxID=6192 RepID=A0A4E0RPQ9_FASHE|nr:hypothetical protein D915_001651 [Fasciola hepatica]
MSRWLTKFTQRLRRNSSKHTSEPTPSPQLGSQRILRPPSVQSGQNASTLWVWDQQGYTPEKNVGDVSPQKNSPEMKKQFGIPLLLTEHIYSSTKELENMGSMTEPPSLDPNLINLSMPPVDTVVRDADVLPETRQPKRLNNLRKWFEVAKKKYKLVTGGIIDRTESEDVRFQKTAAEFDGGSQRKINIFPEEKRKQYKNDKPEKKAHKRERISRRQKLKGSKTTEHSANDSQLSFQPFVDDVLEAVPPEIPAVCESQKLTDDGDTNVGLLVQNVPQLHRSPEWLDQNSLDLSPSTNKRKHSGLVAKQNKPRVHRDSHVAKSEDRTTAEKKTLPSPELSKKDQESQYSPPSSDDNLLTETPREARTSVKRNKKSESQDRNGSTDLQGQKLKTENPPDGVSESDSSVLPKETKSKQSLQKASSKKTKIKKSSISVSISSKVCNTNPRKPTKLKQPKKGKDSETSFGADKNEGAHSLKPKQDTMCEGESNESENSSWCRRICEQDRNLRKIGSRNSEHFTGPLASGRSHCCRKRSGVNKASIHPVRNTPNFSPNQRVNILIRQADNVIEELIDRLAWDMAEAIVSRASYARTLSCHSNQASLMRLRALPTRRQHSSAEGSGNSLPFFQCSRRSTPLVD